MKVKIDIVREKVMGIVEGISVLVSQHNGGTPTFEQLWASVDERKKLDIYYREAVSDLEKRLMDWLSSSHTQFDFGADGADYSVTLTMSRYWPKRLEGLLGNKIQDYLVHSITAGWLNDFEGVTTKQDYAEMAATDLTDIRAIVEQKDLSFTESQRTGDGDAFADEDDAAKTKQRTSDDDKADSEESTKAQERTGDGDAFADDDKAIQTTARRKDKYKSNAGSDDVTVKQRRRDGDWKRVEHRPQTRRRTRDDDAFADDDKAIDAGARHEDNARVCIGHDYTDWSGRGPFDPFLFDDMPHHHDGHGRRFHP